MPSLSHDRVIHVSHDFVPLPWETTLSCEMELQVPPAEVHGFISTSRGSGRRRQRCWLLISSDDTIKSR